MCHTSMFRRCAGSPGCQLGCWLCICMVIHFVFGGSPLCPGALRDSRVRAGSGTAEKQKAPVRRRLLLLSAVCCLCIYMAGEFGCVGRWCILAYVYHILQCACPVLFAQCTTKYKYYYQLYDIGNQTQARAKRGRGRSSLLAF
jgi:hypothetical protein